MKLENITPIIGAQVTGINLADFSQAQAEELRGALADRSVLVFRDQKLDRDAHKRVAMQFGTGVLHRHALAMGRGSDDPEVLRVITTAESKYTAGEGWHTDVTCDLAPIAASALYMHQAPAGGGGDTMFANMGEAYDRLSDPIKALIGNLTAVHDGAKPYASVYGQAPEAGKSFNKSVHPLVIRHPVTGRKLLWINQGFVTKIAGLSALENRHLMDLLFHHIETTLIAQCRVRWHDNTLVLWDNIATQHHAVWDYFPNSRSAERISVVGGELIAA